MKKSVKDARAGLIPESDSHKPGPLERLVLKDYCEMCGVTETAARNHDGGLGLEAAFDPSGKAKTLCFDCRMGSAELLHDYFEEMKAAMLLAYAALPSDKTTDEQWHELHSSWAYDEIAQKCRAALHHAGVKL